jgi:hypothetical protein
MSVIKVNQIKSKLRAMFEPHLDLSGISLQDAERDSKVLTRCLAAFAIYFEAGCTEADAAEAVWDGPDDNGIDGAFYDASESRVLFVQSKWIHKGAGEPEAQEIGTFVKGVKDAIEQDYSDFHSRLHPKLNDLAVRLNTPGTRVHAIVVSTGASQLAKHGQSRLNDLLEELNGADPEPIASAGVIGLAPVYSRLASDPTQSTVTLDANILEWSTITTPYLAYFGIIDGLTLKEWWKAYGKRVVAGNIRHALGATEVNNEIRSTAGNSPERFWYFNNGITLVAEEASKAPAGVASRSAGIFSFKGASIVNGAQTVSSIAKVDDDASLGKVRVPIRVIILKAAPAGFGSEVTRTNNLQNRIEPRDFVAQDRNKNDCEKAIEGVEYQFVRSDETSITPSSCELVEVTTALACASGDASLAVQVKTGISRFFADLQKAPYKAIFNPSLSGAKAFNAVLVQRQIDRWIEVKKKTYPKKSGVGWGALIHGNRILSAAVFRRLGENLLAQSIAAFSTDLSTINVDGVCEAVHANMSETIQNHYANKFLAVLFKNNASSKRVFEEALH